MSLTEQQKKQAVGGWNKHRDTKKIAVTLGVTVDKVVAYLETCSIRGYPGRIRVYTPSSAQARTAPSVPALPKGWG